MTIAMQRLNARIALCAMLCVATGCSAPTLPAVRFPANTTQTDTTSPGAAQTGGRLLSAFFGLDNTLPARSDLAICDGAGNADGMPIIFDREIDSSTLQAGDLRVTTQSGKVGTIVCVTMFPATDAGELRTALLAGEFGAAAGDAPASVTVVGNVLSADGGVNFRGATIAVTPLAEGPTLILAEVVPQDQWKIGATGGPRGNGSGCPDGTRQAVRAVWAGGVVKADGDEAGDAERAQYQISLEQADGGAKAFVPFALADLNDGDNNHLLCLDAAGTPRQVSFPAGLLIDPNGDLNPDAAVSVSAR